MSDSPQSKRKCKQLQSGSPVQNRARHDRKKKHTNRTGQGDKKEKRERLDPNRPIKSEPSDDCPRRSTSGHRKDRVPPTEMLEGLDQTKKEKDQEKAKPDFGLSGKLAEDTNTFKGVVIKYNEPPEARKPKIRWRLYPFKGDQTLPVLHVHRQSAYLLGRDRMIADIPIDHPSCSKQHAVLQFRLVNYKRDNGTTGRRVRPYIIDLESSNATYVNNKQIEPRVYVELFEKDVLKFGYSSREYVLLQENSKDDLSEDGGED